MRHFSDFAVYLKHINTSMLSALFICVWQKVWKWALGETRVSQSCLQASWYCDPAQGAAALAEPPVCVSAVQTVPRAVPTQTASLAPDCWALSCWSTVAREIRNIYYICTLKVILPCKYTHKKIRFVFHISQMMYCLLDPQRKVSVFCFSRPVSCNTWLVTLML